MSNRKYLLPLILISALILRLITAIQHIDMIYPDEHFQVLEPANWVVNGVGWKSWEWYHGIRSWFTPSLYIPILYFLKIFGITAGSTPIIVCKIFTSLFSVFAIYSFYKFLNTYIKSFWTVTLFTIIYSLSPSMIVFGVSTFSDQWSLIMFWAFLPFVLNTILHSEEKLKFILAGIAIGITFLIRIQMAIWFAGLFLTVLFYGNKSQKSNLLYLSTGYLLAVIFQGFLDLFTWGSFLHSTISNVKMNIFQGVAEMNGTSPWYFYFINLFAQFKPIIASILCLTSIYAIYNFKNNLSFEKKLILFPSLLYVLIHIIIGHKEWRFILPMVPVLFYLSAIGTSYLITKFNLYEKLKHSWLYLILIFSIPVSYSNIYSYDYYAQADMSDISDVIYKDGALFSNPNECILILDHFWIWTRGNMAIGVNSPFIEMKSAQFDQEKASKCRYALAMQSGLKTFSTKMPDQWEVIFKNHSGKFLLKRK